ncbi:MAG: hypothetical protein ACI8XU_001960 [Kiritimatiellia bacterium]|jgi:hypothetical protein
MKVHAEEAIGVANCKIGAAANLITTKAVSQLVGAEPKPAIDKWIGEQLTS